MVLLIVALVGCTEPASTLAFEALPTVAANDQGAHLSVWLEVDTTEPTSLEISLTDGASSPRTFRVPEERRDHRVFVGGLRPDREHGLVVVATSESQDAVAHTVVFRSDPLPEDFPVLQVRSDPTKMEPGLTLIHLGPYLMMLDADGEVRWYMPSPTRQVHTFRTTPQGTLFFHHDRMFITTFEPSGAPILQWCAAAAPRAPSCDVAVDAPAFHHDALMLPNGDWLTLSVEVAVVEGFPTSEIDTEAPAADTAVAADVVLQFDPEGRIVQQWRLLELLDPRRIGHESVTGDYWSTYFDRPLSDWSHANALGFDPDREEVLVSVRHQDVVVALDLHRSELTWILGQTAHWTTPWSDALLAAANPAQTAMFHQHGATITPLGTLLLFDNGTPGANAFSPTLDADDQHSRAMEFRIDHGAGLWELEWSHDEDQRILGTTVGGAYAMPNTGNRLISFGNVSRPDDVGTVIQEVTRTAEPEVVFEVISPEGLPTAKAFRVSGLLEGL